MSLRLPRKVPVLIDANLAILVCVGFSGTQNIEKHKRLAAYDEQDFHLLAELLGYYRKLVFSPYVLGETSNLLRQVADPLKRQLVLILRQMILLADEIQMSCAKIVDDSRYLDLGMTDAALLSILDAHPQLRVRLEIRPAGLQMAPFCASVLTCIKHAPRRCSKTTIFDAA